MMRVFFILILCVFPMQAFACYVTPPEQIAPIDELISRTNNIVVARVIEAKLTSYRSFPEYHVVDYKFENVESLKGQVDKTFNILGSNTSPYKKQTAFVKPLDNNVKMFSKKWFEQTEYHNDETFWKSDIGRVSHEPTCNIRPDFLVGQTYLIFLDKPYHQKSFELMPQGLSTDKWYEYVKNKVNE